MRNNFSKLIFIEILLFIAIFDLPIKAQNRPFGTVKIEDNVYLDQTEIDVGSWLSFYSWTIIHKGYGEAQKLLPDSSSIEPELWTYIKTKSDNFIDKQAGYSLQPIGYFAKDCKECVKFGKRISSSKNYCPMLYFPITGVTYEQVNEFCKWRTLIEGDNKIIFRLPTPDEWKKFAIKGLSESEIRNGLRDSMNTKKCALYNYRIKCECNKDLTQGIIVIGAYDPDKTGAYEVFGNVSEMTSIKGISKGGNYRLYAKQCHLDSVQSYHRPELWLGFRCIAIKNVSSSSNNTIQLNTAKDSSSNTNIKSKFGKITDSRDGKTYPTVSIGNQIWLAANLSYKPDSGKYWAPENDANKIAMYGYLYNWETAQNVCPSGSHLPSKEDFEILLQNEEIKELKVNLIASGNSGFSALMGGFHDGINYLPSKIRTAFWTSSVSKKCIWLLFIEQRETKASTYDIPKKNSIGYSVRCLIDNK